MMKRTMNAADECITRACEAVPGLVRCALVLLPEGLLIGGIGAGSVLDHEPLIRSAARCLAVGPTPVLGKHAAFVEYLFVTEEHLVVIQGGRRETRLALGVTCTREPNLAFVLSSTRQAMRAVEDSFDLVAWGG
jgi:hypothetical protein